MTLLLAATPSLIAIAIKLGILIFAISRRHSNTFLWLVAMLSINNLAELSIFFGEGYGISPTHSMKMYYVSIIFMMLAIWWYVVELLEPKLATLIFNISISLYPIIALICIATNWIIAGTTPLNFGYTAIKGNHYWMFSAIALFTILSVSIGLLYGYKKSLSQIKKHQCGWVLASLSTLIIISLIVTVLMMLEVQVNALMVIPIGTTFFVLTMLFSERQHGMTEVKHFLPPLLENQTRLNLAQVMNSYLHNGIPHYEALHEVEKIMVQHKINKEKYKTTLNKPTVVMPPTKVRNPALYMGNQKN